jgi:Flp pilus assembly pilin Flp
LGHWRADRAQLVLIIKILPYGIVVSKRAGILRPKRSELARSLGKESPVAKLLQRLWNEESGQDIAEYAVMLAVILVIVVGTIRLIGSNANNVFSNVGSAIQ